MRAGGPREALREPDAPGELTLGGRPPSSPAARRRSRSREEGAVAPASAARSSPAHGRVACARSRGGRPPFARRRARLPPTPRAHSCPLQTAAAAARSGTDRHERRHPTDRPGSFSAANLKRAWGRNPGSYCPAPVAAGWRAEALGAASWWRRRRAPGAKEKEGQWRTGAQRSELAGRLLVTAQGLPATGSWVGSLGLRERQKE